MLGSSWPSVGECILLVVLSLIALVWRGRIFLRRHWARPTSVALESHERICIEKGNGAVAAKPPSLDAYLRVAKGDVNLDSCFRRDGEDAGGLLAGVCELPFAATSKVILAARGAASRHLALVRKSLWWMEPTTTAEDARHCSFLVFETSPEREAERVTVVLIPMAVDNTMLSFVQQGPSKDGKDLLLGLDCAKTSTFPADKPIFSRFYLFVTSRSPQEACFRAVKGLEQVLARLAGPKPPAVVETEKPTSPPSASGGSHHWLDRLGWCSWNAFYQDVTAEGVTKAVDDVVSRLNLQVGYVIVDDGYEQLSEDARLAAFEPDRTKFPDGLKGLVGDLKALGVERVGIWHTLQGYWNGLDPETFRAKYPSIRRVGDKAYLPTSPADVAAFLRDLHAYLGSQGIDFFKIDNQASMELVLSTDPDLWRIYLDALAGSTQRTDVIYCMAQSPLIYARSLSNRSSEQQQAALRLVRNSDDYFPDDPLSHPTHAYANIMNVLYSANLSLILGKPSAGIVADFDELRTDRPYAAFHAALRALHNGPVYLADPPECTVAEVVRPLVIGSKAGTRVLRPAWPACPVGDIFEDPRTPDVNSALKVGNATDFQLRFPGGSGKAVCWTVGMFNLKALGSNVSVMARTSLAEVQSALGWRYRSRMPDPVRHIAYSFLTGSAVIAPPVDGFLSPQEFDVITFAPLFPVHRVSVAPLGMTSKYNGAAAIVRAELTESTMSVTFRGRSVVAFAVVVPLPYKASIKASVRGQPEQELAVTSTLQHTYGNEYLVLTTVDCRIGGIESLEQCTVDVSV
ncbi:glycoside hydrolase superfamily [Hyaloraphidium curvatum]|nr:glycoside hydrolase superfamily [Hyaloraphidium curvatum]